MTAAPLSKTRAEASVRARSRVRWSNSRGPDARTAGWMTRRYSSIRPGESASGPRVLGPKQATMSAPSCSLSSRRCSTASPDLISRRVRGSSASVCESTTFRMAPRSRANSRLAGLSMTSLSGQVPAATCSQYGTTDSYSLREPAQVSARANVPLRKAVSSSPHAKGCQNDPSALLIRPSSVVCMRTVSLRMSLLLVWWCGSADRERRDGQGADADAEPLTAADALAQRDGGEQDRHGRVERGQHGGHAEVGGVGGQ